MKAEEFLNKFGNMEVTFHSLYKENVAYINEELDILVVGNIEYRTYLKNKETVNRISELENFDFQINNKGRKK